jgi:hypothetical protein
MSILWKTLFKSLQSAAALRPSPYARCTTHNLFEYAGKPIFPATDIRLITLTRE